MAEPDAWDDSDNEWELNDAPVLPSAPAAAPAAAADSSSEEEEGHRPEVNYKGVAGGRAAKSALELKMEANDAKRQQDAAAAAAEAAAALSLAAGDYLAHEVDASDSSMTEDQRRKAKAKAARDTRHAKARAFLKDGQLRGLDEDAAAEREAAVSYDIAARAGGSGGQPFWREEEAGDEIIISAERGGQVASAEEYMGGARLSEASLASGRVVNANAAGIAPPAPGEEPAQKEDKTQRTSKKEQARQKERQKQAEAEAAREDASWEVGARPEKGKGRKGVG
eukprot:Transcript_30141.p1 GENE.Transcript_30141~~Transcript_30141.p1  ORF type:complete len:281 (-),score=108.58 Transcript_30141:262-1104(-)